MAALRAIDWPVSLRDEVAELTDALPALGQTPATADDSEVMGAAGDAKRVESRFSRAVYDWLATQQIQSDAQSDVLATSVAAAQIVRRETTSTGPLARVDDLLTVVRIASWPAAVAPEAEVFAASLKRLLSVEPSAATASAHSLDVEAEVEEAGLSLLDAYYEWLYFEHKSIDHAPAGVALVCAIVVPNALSEFDLAAAIGTSPADVRAPTAATTVARPILALTSGAGLHGPASGAGSRLDANLRALDDSLRRGGATEATAEVVREAQSELSRETSGWLTRIARLKKRRGDHPEPFPISPDVSMAVTMGALSYDSPQLFVHAGEWVELTLENSAPYAHDFTIDEFGADVYTPAASSGPTPVTASAPTRPALRVEVEARGSATARFLAVTPGAYRYYCTVRGHRQLGMEGRLIIIE